MMTKKDIAFGVFSEGKGPTSPELKAAGLRYDLRYKYYNEWKKAGRPVVGAPSSAEISQAAKKRKKRDRGKKPLNKVELAGGEAIYAYKPEGTQLAQEEPRPSDETAEGEEEGDEEAASRIKGKPVEVEPIKIALGGDHEYDRSIPEKIIGSGIPVTVTLSLKTLALYEIASTVQPKLELGDFLDHCTEDFFTGRGKDLGIIETGGSKHG